MAGIVGHVGVPVLGHPAVAFEEAALAAVRRYATERDTSDNAPVRERLTRMAEQADRAAWPRTRILQLSGKSKARNGAASWQRDDLHER